MAGWSTRDGRQLADQWSLSIGAPFQPGGQTAWVAPVHDATGRTLVLKIGWPHREARDEARGLKAWAGHGAVQLHQADTFDDSVGLLLEQCLPGTPLAALPEEEQDVVIAGLLQRLWQAPLPTGHGFRALQTMCDHWADEFETKAAAGAADRGLAREGLSLFRALPATAEREVLLCTDLHAENVLAARRESWLVIDPKPYVGDPTYDALQHLLNCQQRLHANPRPRLAPRRPAPPRSRAAAAVAVRPLRAGVVGRPGARRDRGPRLADVITHHEQRDSP